MDTLSISTLGSFSLEGAELIAYSSVRCRSHYGARSTFISFRFSIACLAFLQSISLLLFTSVLLACIRRFEPRTSGQSPATLYHVNSWNQDFFYQYEGYGIGCYTYFCTCQHNGMKVTPICHLFSRFTIDKSLKIPSIANVVVFQNISYRKGNHSVNAGSGVLQTSLEPLNSVAQQGCSLFLLPHGVLLLV